MVSAEPLDRRSRGIGAVGDPLCDTNKISAAWEGADNPNPNSNGMEHENQTAIRATFPTSHHVTPLIRLTARERITRRDHDEGRSREQLSREFLIVANVITRQRF